MGAYTAEELTEALRAIDSVILECGDAQEKSSENMTQSAAKCR
ncbi:hypothetical protein [Coriobacterium glomerans]|nr:hypothetical protein [Coriobacterium glomerans]